MAERLPQMLDLARSLVAATDEGRLDWNRQGTTAGQFDATVGGLSVSIASADPEGGHPFVLVLWEPDETTHTGGASSAATWTPLEKLSTQDLIEGAPEWWVRVLAQLWRVARTQALKVDERLDAVLAELQRKAVEAQRR